MSKLPPITVGVMTYDRIEFLKETIRSVLSQTFTDFELIIGNDCPSVPVDFKVLGIRKDSRVKIINHLENLGEASNMNYLLHETVTEWFTWIADDDLLHPRYLELLYENIKIANNFSIVGAYSNYSHGTFPGGIFPKEIRSSKNSVYSSADFFLKYTSKKIKLIGCFGLMKTKILKKIGGIPSLGNSFGPYSDTLIPILLMKFGKISWLDQPLLFFRTHPESLSIKSSDFLAYTSAETEFLDQLNKTCSSKNLECVRDIGIFNMLVWFAADEICVLARNSDLNSFAIVKKYIKQQYEVNMKRVPNKYKINYFLIIIYNIYQYLFSMIIRKIFSAVSHTKNFFGRFC